MSNRGYEAVIGLEIHAQLKTKSKMFSSDSASFDGGDNENTSEVSVGFPGALPTVNRQAIYYAIKTGLALNCKIRKHSIFARKNYFYPDLPKGYQISQYDKPICENGYLTFLVNGEKKKVRIERAHMEEDAGKSTHLGDYTLVNYNRSGVPLLEIVSAPDIRTAQEAAEYARNIRQILRYLDVCDGNLEEGSLRCDCNVSVRLRGEEKLGTKVEIKNINSFRFVEKAIEYEIDRQIDAIEAGEKIIQETRLYDPDKNRTYSMRSKEDAHDYRYFPDPDLLPVNLSDGLIEGIQSEIPELPLKKQDRFIQEHSLPEQDAATLTEERELADFFEKTAEISKNSKSASNWILTELLRELNRAQIVIAHSPISPQMLGELIRLIDEGKISGKIAKSVFLKMWESPQAPSEIIKTMGLSQITDSSHIEKIIDEVLQAHSEQVAEYRSGKVKLFGFFVGAVMKASRGQASPEITNQILKRKLGG